jgi:hypothetical protein
MIRDGRSLRVAAVLLGLLGATIAIAKPPDLPQKQEDTVGTPAAEPQIPSQLKLGVIGEPTLGIVPPDRTEGFPIRLEPPGMSSPSMTAQSDEALMERIRQEYRERGIDLLTHLPVPTRRTLTASLLFVVHPLCALMPIDDLVDASFDPPPADDPRFSGPIKYPDRLLHQDEAGPKEPSAGSHPTEPTCPFLRCEAARSGSRPLTLGDDPLANLDRIQEARALSAMALVLRDSGQTWEAREAWTMVRRLAPGSRFDVEAQEMLAATAPHQEGTSGAAETAEPPATDDSTRREIDDFFDGLFGTLRQAIPAMFPFSIDVRIEVEMQDKKADDGAPLGLFPLVKETYPVAGLIVPRRNKVPSCTAPDEEELITWIESIDSSSWQKQGGLGSIEYVPESKSLVVRQTASVHKRISAFLRLLTPCHEPTDPVRADDLHRLTMACLVSRLVGDGFGADWFTRQLLAADPIRVLANPALRDCQSSSRCVYVGGPRDSMTAGEPAGWDPQLLDVALPPPMLTSWGTEAFGDPSPSDSIPRLWRRVADTSGSRKAVERVVRAEDPFKCYGLWGGFGPTLPRQIGPPPGWAVWGVDPHDPPAGEDEPDGTFGTLVSGAAFVESTASEGAQPASEVAPVMPYASDDPPPEPRKPASPEAPYPLCRSGQEESHQKYGAEESPSDLPEGCQDEDGGHGSLVFGLWAPGIVGMWLSQQFDPDIFMSLGIGGDAGGIRLSCDIRSGKRTAHISFVHNCGYVWESQDEKGASQP